MNIISECEAVTFFLRFLIFQNFFAKSQITETFNKLVNDKYLANEVIFCEYNS